MKKFAAILLSAALAAPLATPTFAQPAPQNAPGQNAPGQNERRDNRSAPNAAPNAGGRGDQGAPGAGGHDRGAPAGGRDDRGGPNGGPNGRPGPQAQGRDQGPPPGGYKSFRKGDRFDSRYAHHYQAIDYRKYHRLKPPPRGQRYVRSGNDALLINNAGVVISITTGLFR